jgi:hypothetical protein
MSGFTAACFSGNYYYLLALDRFNDLVAILINGQCRIVSEFHGNSKNTSRTLYGNMRWKEITKGMKKNLPGEFYCLLVSYEVAFKVIM